MLRKIVKFADENNLELDSDFRFLLKIHETAEPKNMDIQKANRDSAEVFVAGYGDVPLSKKEFEAILASFGALSASEALEWAADWIENGANAIGNQDIKEFTANMTMTIRAVAHQPKSS